MWPSSLHFIEGNGHDADMQNLVTRAELREIASDLRAMAAVETADNVREALNRLADRYGGQSDRTTTAPGAALPISLT